ncbi:MAG: roadblock/LC7 domain-containing protein [Thermoleophilia bacterium]|nr:roadblock/LC7 domain-containing protein [Thermoleophilia bacterium]
MGENQTILTSQLVAATHILRELSDTIDPEFLGLISTVGQPVSVISSTKLVDSDSIASLAANSYAASQQLASMVEDSARTVMLHEGARFNIQIAQVTKSILLVICFRRSSDIGRVRLIASRTVESLAEIFISEGDKYGAD